MQRKFHERSIDLVKDGIIEPRRFGRRKTYSLTQKGKALVTILNMET